MGDSQPQPKPAQRPRWYCRINDEELGPLTDRQLKKLVKTEQLTRADDIRKGTNGKWVPAERVKGLFPQEVVDVDPPSEPAATPLEPVATAPDPLTSPLDAVEDPPTDPLTAPISDPQVHELPEDPLTADLGDTANALLADPLPLATLSSSELSSAPSGDVAQSQTDVAKPASEEAAGRNKVFLWAAVGGGALGLVVLCVVVGVAVFMFRGDDTQVAQTPATPAADSEPMADVSGESSAAEETDRQLPANAQSSATEPEPGQPLDAATPASASEPPAAKPEFGESVAQAQASVSEVQSDSAPPTSSSEPTSASAETPVTSSGDSLGPPATTPPESLAGSPVKQGVSDTQAETKATPSSTENSSNGVALIETDKGPEKTTEPAIVAQQPPRQDVSSVGLAERETEEGREAEKEASRIDGLVKLRLKQVAERADLTKRMQANRKEYEAVVAALRVVSEQLPKMKRQYRFLEDSLREATAREQKDSSFRRARMAVQKDMAALAQQIVQATSTGNKAMQAKPDVERAWQDQNKELADLQQREGPLHLELMEELDPYGHRSARYRAALLDVAFEWDSACAEACLIRGLAQMHEERYQQSIEDFSLVIDQFEGVLKQKRVAKNAPELRVVQAALAGRGFALFRTGKEPESLSDLGKAISANREYTVASVFRGMVEVERGRHDAAMRDFEAARRFDDPHASREAARLLLTSPSLANPKRALQLAKEACDQATSWANEELHAAALAATSQPDVARESYRKAVELAPLDQVKRIESESAKLDKPLQD